MPIFLNKPISKLFLASFQISEEGFDVSMLILFQTKTCDFPYPISGLTKFPDYMQSAGEITCDQALL